MALPCRGKGDVSVSEFREEQRCFQYRREQVSNSCKNKYDRQAMFVKFVGMHQQYDEVDVGSL